ncbi:MAG: rhodanese-like domain-containing protein [Nitrospinota bacterium]|nr:rhodanese-like domain-containing protein [Nitrospinota bacterium]
MITAGKYISPLAGLCALLILTQCTAAGDDKFKKETEKEKETIKVVRETSRGGYGVISVEELKKLLDAKEDILVIDTMPYEESYKAAHIPSAKQFLFPVDEMKEWSSFETSGKSQEDYAALLGPAKERKIAVYCGFVKCGRSHNGAMWAVKLGYANVLRLPGGIYAWKGAGYPTEQVD